MVGKEFTGETLVQALEAEALTPVASGGVTLVGMVKRSDQPHSVSFSPAGCDAWVDVPTAMIEKATHIGDRGCDDHTHPVFRITLKEPGNVEGKLLASLLTASSRRPVGGHLPATPLGGVQFSAAALNCDRGCQALLRKCIQDTPFSSEFCVFVYSNCYHLCNLFGTVIDVFGSLDAQRR